MAKIEHILLYRFKPGIDRIDEHLEVIRGFRGATEGLMDLQCGRNVAAGSGGRFTHGFVMTFESRPALEKYNGSDAHRRLVSPFRDDMEEKLVVDIQVS